MPVSWGSIVLSCCLLLPFGASAKTLRIASGHAPPLIERGENGQPRGFAPEALEEAARRAGVRLVWIPGGTSDENDRALREGRLDAMTTSGVTPERRRRFYISEAWWALDLIRLSVDGRPEPPTRTLAAPPGLVAQARVIYPRDRVVGAANAPAAAAAMCAGKADGALIARVYLAELLLEAPVPCRVLRIKVADAPMGAGLSLVGSRAAAAIVRDLRERLDEMTLDGTLARIARRHPPLSAEPAARMAELLRERYRRRLRDLALAGALIGLAGTALFAFFQVRARRRLRAALSKLARSEAVSRAYFERMALGSARVRTANGRFIAVNDRLCTMLGYTHDELLRLGIADVTHPADHEADRQMMADLQSGEADIVVREKRYLRKDGSVMWGRLHVTTIEENGEKTNLSVIEDITERKEAEVTIKKLEGLLPICASCKRIRDDRGRWQGLEAYIREHSEAEFTHGMCPECIPKYWPVG